MKILTFGTLKGGVGKTMLCFNIGGILSQLGYKILIIDSDLQGNLTNNIGINRTDPSLLTTYDIFNVDEKQKSPDEIVLKKPNENMPNLDMISGSIFLHKAELKISMVAGREQILKNYFEDYKDFFNQYDYVLIDTNPSMSVVNQNAFLLSDSIILVSDVSLNSLEGSQLFIALWLEAAKRLRKKNNIHGFVVNDYDKRTKISSDFLDYLKNAEDLADIREIMFNTIIPRNVSITESELAAIPINLYNNKSAGFKAIASLIDEMFNRKIL